MRERERERSRLYLSWITVLDGTGLRVDHVRVQSVVVDLGGGGDFIITGIAKVMPVV